MVKYDKEQFENSKSNDLISCICSGCASQFDRKKRGVSKAIKRERGIFCTHDCYYAFARKDALIYSNCGVCNTSFSHTLSRLKSSKSGMVFCSKGCSITRSNKNRKIIHYCSCGNKKTKRSKTCRACYSAKAESRLHLPISHFFYKKGQNKTGRIRHLARKHYHAIAERRCVICGYSKHIEVAHIIPVSDFDEDTPISIVNSLENIIGLCPNHHWELDNDELSILVLAM